MNTGTFNQFMRILSKEVQRDDHVVLIMDQAGWHRSKALRLPGNVTLLYLPTYSPELNPLERLWGYMLSHSLCNRVFWDYEHLLQAGTQVYRALTPERIQAICGCEYLTRMK